MYQIRNLPSLLLATSTVSKIVTSQNDAAPKPKLLYHCDVSNIVSKVTNNTNVRKRLRMARYSLLLGTADKRFAEVRDASDALGHVEQHAVKICAMKMCDWMETKLQLRENLNSAWISVTIIRAHQP